MSSDAKEHIRDIFIFLVFLVFINCLPLPFYAFKCGNSVSSGSAGQFKVLIYRLSSGACSH